MADVKRWSVTYTKHIKQKRKVYQDGFLELHASTNKLLLYDECEKLLECRILKRDEAVSCGETLTFNAFLVDVNSAEGHHEPMAPPVSKSIGRGNRSGTENSKSQKLNLSPSQQIIRDFKKREILKYEVMKRKSPDSTKSSVAEWEVLYTTQLTQKAKKYHDGFVQLSARGSTARQVMLFDTGRNSIGSKFLKKDEKIESGETIRFDGHLVEIGEPQGDYKSSGGNNCIVTGEKVVIQRQDSYAYGKHTLQKELIKVEVKKEGVSNSSQDTTEASATEWQVLYTTQLTQKSKKYHDGFLRLAICGSRGRQAMLYDADKTILRSSFLKKEEVIRTGVTFKFDAYLIDVGEPEGTNEIKSTPVENNCNLVKNTEKVHIQQDSLTSSSYTLKGKSLSTAGSRIYAKSDFSIFKQDTTEPVKTSPANKPLRDARQILSILQKPKPENSAAINCMDNKMTTAKGTPVLNVADLNTAKCTPKTTDVRESIEGKDLDRSAETRYSKEMSNDSGSQLQKGIDNGNSDQVCSDFEAEKKRQNVANSVSSGAVNDAKSPEAPLVEFPSFSLGF